MQSAISLLNANSGTAQDKEVFEPATNIAPNSNHIQQLNKRETHERDGQNQQEMKRKQQKQRWQKQLWYAGKRMTKNILNLYHGMNVKFVVYGFMSCAMVIIAMTRIYVALV